MNFADINKDVIVLIFLSKRDKNLYSSMLNFHYFYPILSKIQIFVKCNKTNDKINETFKYYKTSLIFLKEVS